MHQREWNSTDLPTTDQRQYWEDRSILISGLFHYFCQVLSEHFSSPGIFSADSKPTYILFLTLVHIINYMLTGHSCFPDSCYCLVSLIVLVVGPVVMTKQRMQFHINMHKFQFSKNTMNNLTRERWLKFSSVNAELVVEHKKSSFLQDKSREKITKYLE